MRILPAAGPERKRLLLLAGALAILGAAYWWGGFRSTPSVAETATGPLPAPTAADALRGPASAGSRERFSAATGSRTPEPLKLGQIEQIPEEPEAGRNLFRFGVRPPPPAPPPQVNLPPTPPPPMPTGPPPIPLKLTGLMADPYGRARAYLKDPSGAVFEAVEGQVVDGRYRLVKIGTSSVVMSYLDGSGQRTIALGG